MKTIFFLFMCFPLLAMGLEIDEKLTVRIVKTSESRKTVMVNRGTEDGVVEGDHAKFIVTAGIVARGVCVKVSPTRSIWSIYRLVNADFIVNDAVMAIKITPPVKITKDETQALVQEDTPTRVSTDPTALGIPLADGAQDLSSVQDSASSDLKALMDSEVESKLVEKNKEIFGTANISGLTAQTKTSTGLYSSTSSQASHHIGLGGEIYPRREREWYSSFSLLGSANLMRLNSQAYNGASVTNDVTEFSLGVNWHITKLPSAVNEFIPFIYAGVNLGSVKSAFKPGTENSGGIPLSGSGSTNGFSAGFGYKFYTSKGFGVRALLDYYVRNEKYSDDVLANAHNKMVAGPRLMLGLSYRFSL